MTSRSRKQEPHTPETASHEVTYRRVEKEKITKEEVKKENE